MGEDAMQFVRQCVQQFQNINWFSLIVIKIGFVLAACYSLTSILSSVLFFYSPSPERSLMLIHAGLDGTFPVLATAIVAAILCDMIFQDMKKSGKIQ